MREFEHAQQALKSILIDQLPFNLAINTTLKNEKNKIDRDFKMSVTAVTGCALRHYYIFKELATRKYGELDDEKLSLLLLGLANHLFAKRFEEKEFHQYIAKETGLEGVEEFILANDNPKSLIPEDIDPESKKYIHYRFNLPYWLVNMWAKNNGPILSKKLYFSFASDNIKVVRINEQKNSSEVFFKNNPEFHPVEDDGLAVYKEKENIKRHQAIKNQSALLIPAGYLYMCKDLDLDPIRGIAVYAESENHLLDELFVRLGHEPQIEYICGDQKTYFDAKATADYRRMKQVALYEAHSEAIITCISKPVHTFFVCPLNSMYANLKEYPDFFLKCNQEDLDGYIQEEEKALNEASPLVEKGGDLVYFIPTICKNEGHTLIHRFLKNHPEYVLKEERQLFPFDRYKSTLYFAILRKEEKHD